MKRLLLFLLLFLGFTAPLSAQTKVDTVTTSRVDSTARVVWDKTVTTVRVITARPDTTVKPPIDTVVVPPPVTGKVLFIDDFEDGSWYTKNCDQANASGGLAQEGGWCGTIYGGKAYPKAAVCGNVGYRSNCAAVSVWTGGQDAEQADVSVTPASSDLYIRFYTKPEAGYQFGAEKVLTLNKASAGNAGIYFGNLHINCGAGDAKSTGMLQWQPAGPSPSGCRDIITMSPGRWYYIEVHIKPSANLLEVWANDCGASGPCAGTPTKRLTLTNYPLASGSVGSVWLQAYSNPVSHGKRWWDAVKISTGFNGF